MNLPDIQNTKVNSIKINRVGVSNVDFPIYVKTKSGDKVLCYAKVSIYMSLKHNLRGINMSRTTQSLMRYRYTSFDRWVLWKFLYDLKKRNDSDDVYTEITFKYFTDKEAPVTKEKSVLAHDCTFIGHINKNNHYTFRLKVRVTGTSVCPCSRSISRVGAHNQRSIAAVTVETKKGRTLWFEDLIKLVESQFSCEVYSVLKRPDEKYVTEKGYENAKFVEDIARDIALALQKTNLLKWYKVKVENEESIHAHNAVAYICRELRNNHWVTCSLEVLRR